MSASANATRISGSRSVTSWVAAYVELKSKYDHMLLRYRKLPMDILTASRTLIGQTPLRLGPVRLQLVTLGGMRVCFNLAHAESDVVTRGFDNQLRDFARHRLFQNCAFVVLPSSCTYKRVVAPLLLALIEGLATAEQERSLYAEPARAR